MGERVLAELVREVLGQAHYAVHLALDSSTASSELGKGRWDLVLVDDDFETEAGTPLLRADALARAAGSARVGRLSGADPELVAGGAARGARGARGDGAAGVDGARANGPRGSGPSPGRAAATANWPALPKPFRPAELLAFVEACLA